MSPPRFLIVLGAPAEPMPLQKPAGPSPDALACVIRRDGLFVAASSNLAVMRVGETGIILGRLFAESQTQTVRQLSASQASRIAASDGRELLEHWHGDYVAMGQTPGGVWVLRPPFGSLPCLYHDDGTHVIVASDIDTMTTVLGGRFQLDYEAIARQLIAGDLRTSHTALAGVLELRGGDRLRWAAGRVAYETLWSPATFTASTRDGRRQARSPAALWDNVRIAVARATSHLTRPLLMLSGGLDSSLIACALAADGRDFVALNLVAPQATGDERHYARQVAAACHRALIERPMMSALASKDLPDLPGSPGLPGLQSFRLPRPVIRSFEQNLHDQARVIAYEAGCDGIIDGGGGDNMFCALQSAAPVADCLLDRRGWLHLWPMCANVGRIAQVSNLAVLRRAIARAAQASRPPGWLSDLRFLPGDAAAMVPRALGHPWLQIPDQLPGRAAHIALLVAAQGYAEDGPHGAKSLSVAPLLCQQLAEYCLSIPSWEWFDRGRNRAAVRHALVGRLPTQVLWRRGKGTPDSYVAALFETQRHRLHEHLGDGLLASAGVIDRAAVRTALADPRPVQGTDYIRILQLADAETWARDIAGRGQ